jgi:hypothetical protein
MLSGKNNSAFTLPEACGFPGSRVGYLIKVQALLKKDQPTQLTTRKRRVTVIGLFTKIALQPHQLRFLLNLEFEPPGLPAVKSNSNL